MRVLVVGAHHGLGQLVKQVAQAAGHNVVPFVGDVLDLRSLSAQMKGCDAVLSTLGPRKDSPPALCSVGERNIVDAMKENGVRRLVQVTGAMIGHPPQKLGLMYRTIRSAVPHTMLADRIEQETIVRKSGLDWTLIRPTRLTNAAPLGRWRTSELDKVGAFARIARADVAEAMVRCLTDAQSVGRGLTLQY